MKEQGKRAKTKRNHGDHAPNEIALIRSHKHDLEALEGDVDASFAAVGADLRAKNLPQVILDRHSQAVADFKARQTQFKQLLQNMGNADDANSDSGRDAAIDALLAFFTQYPQGKKHTPLDPQNLPFRTPSGNVRPPATTPSGFPTALLDAQRLMVTGPISVGTALPSAKSASAAPTAADLAPTEDVQITQQIRDLASSLGNNPVKIYNWVRNNVEYLPTYGSIQGSDLTLTSKRGNAFDTASLLISLYRAANIPARYVYGTIEVPISQVMNWVGGVGTPNAALSLLGQGGVPSIAVVSGGAVSATRLEHVWVEAYVDYVPSRGAINKTPATWVSMDPSFKQYTYTTGMNIKTNVPFDANAFSAQVAQGSTTSSSEGWIQNVSATNVQAGVAVLQTQIHNYINSIKPNATAGDVLGRKTVVARDDSVLLGSRPYKTLLTGSRFDAIPDQLRWHLQFLLYANEFDRANDSPAFDVTRSLPAIANKRIEMSYEPSTNGDAQVITSALDAYQTRFPAYLVRMTPKLKLESDIVGVGASSTVGDEQIMTVAVRGPSIAAIDRDYRLFVGDVSTIIISAAGVTADTFAARTSSVDLRQTIRPDYVPEMLFQIGLGWWGEKHAFEDILASINGIVRLNMPSHSRVSAPITTRYFFGVPRSASYRTRTIDSKLDELAVVHQQDNSDARRQFLLGAGHIGSYLEGGIFEQMFLAEMPYGVSTVSLLKAANDQHLRIYSINQGNVVQTLSQLNVSQDVVSDVANAVAAGFRVTIPQSDVSHFGYTGIGYIVENPATGEAAYQVDGGTSGGSSPTGEAVYPLPQVPATPIVGILIGSTLRSAAMSLAVEGGIIEGLAIPPLIGACAATGICVAGLVLIALIVSLIIVSSQATTIEQRYPRTSRVLRHFTLSIRAALIDGSKVVIGGTGGTYNPDFPAVYFADPRDPQASVSCPPTADQSARVNEDYEMGAAPPDDQVRANAFVDVEITRSGYWDAVIFERINDHATREVIFRLPFVYYGRIFAVAIGDVGACY